METKELRQGNLIEYNGEVLPICCLQSDNTFRLFKDGESIGCYSGSYKGSCYIPLTEEWLLKFGVKTTTGYDENGLEMLYIKTEYFEVQCSYILLEYVHQLQNLYFALTGAELTLKEK